ncbi:MAG TPA: LLM class flavin-dependent oxidoreductase [Candidatus Corynebacterium avicola]|uniref:LLM class flavin-dependent oxidoreductase n=1 Tax=Candidatus Corynebacterium avicola TaxID=2838527 RepID=A0A9D1ULI0_9CORY|nr:LLM class flavin-dependent oxidoreductase [Candidatus Corynebacterium avicola]
MTCVVHQSPGLWRHPDDQAHRYNDLSYWTELAQLLESGYFDGIFIADVLGLYDLYGASPEAALKAGAQVPVNDPLPLISAMATVTEHLGFGLTTGTAFEHPFPFARRITTLDQLTNGRLGWNVVTGYLPSAAENTRSRGQLDTFDHDARYDHADEYLEVLYKFWEGSWEDDAVLADPLTGVYTDASKVHPINHTGENYSVPGIHVSEPSPQRTPVIFQAGASERGSTFAATHAESVFVAAPTQDKLAEVVTTLTRKLEDAGRSREDVVIYALFTIITDDSDEQAQAKATEYRNYIDHEGSLTLMSGWMGVDFSTFDLDDPVADIESNAIQSAVAAFQKSADVGAESGSEWTVRELAEFGGIGGLGPVVVGSGESVADQLEEWVDATGVDGFNLAYAVTPGTFQDVITHVIPVLQDRGEYPTSYTGGTLRHELFGRGDKVPDNHPAHTARRDLQRAAKSAPSAPSATTNPDQSTGVHP